MAAGKTILAFDAYGTLLSTESIAKKLAEHFGEEKAKSVAASWRKFQLEYTWRLNSMNTYVDFEEVTRGSLRNALLEAGVSLNEDQIADMMHAYDSLSIFPDVAKTLEALRHKDELYPVVFSNGTSKMVATSIKESPDLKDHNDVLKDIIVVEQPRRYKPAPDVYHHLAKQVGKDASNTKEMAEMWLISGNPFDVVGARSVGMNAAWVDRAGAGWQDHLLTGENGKPSVIVQKLDDIVEAIRKHQR
ncbi:hypothetical protein AMS68_006043 [Peltaster fructicola]|uniref:Haloacid dehalogenase, type II n=1 Tax=Peltaster fructicola TaxID=286661 RepID=A0A6H0Y0R9_9PEZI|nr:hypothetical protein AMS68_006043 [Peltaster fructicola]